ncbi:hypothetical protein [Bacillus alveayuensis]|jgi:hypothetical protein|uniref:hypothetical protein n=1 Tax=Aeribacillus alveayuensis TaxID=279215 RepID=UPI0005CD7E50|nr:hypothetical protein [Bacillus alveayuensis]
MNPKLMSIFLGFLAGLLFIRTLPNKKPFEITEFLLELILHPVQFFLAMLFFFISFLANAYLLKKSFEETYLFLKKGGVKWHELLLSYTVVFTFYLLFLQSFWYTISLLLFSIIYSLLSLEFKIKNEVDLKKLNRKL